jgi:membrane-bound lytic murein transglycosylase D
MKPLCLSLMVLLFTLLNLSFIAPTESIDFEIEENNAFNLSDFEVRERLDKIGGIMDLKYNSHVEKNIRLYLGRRKRTLAYIIGKSETYFPLFEHYLQVNQLPDELKYLSIVESALNPRAKSPVGASGLWQFMKGTGLRYGLKVDSYIDERNDPIKSTEASFKFLKDLHDRYDDWSLALAAYNCGPGNVNKAIRRSGSTDFWKMSRYLPSETRNYVPTFIATVYVMNYYQTHGIQPKPAAYKFQDIKTTTLFEASSFYEISKLAEIETRKVRELNPAYRRNFIPKTRRGNYLTLPVEAMRIFKDKKRQAKLNGFYKSRNPDYYDYMNIPSDMIRSSYEVQKGESVEYIAKLLRCSVDDIVEWNKLPAASIFNGQELIVYFPKEKFSDRIVAAIPKAEIEEIILESTINKDLVAEKKELEESNILYHSIQKGETLGKISTYYPNVTLSEIIRINNFFGEIKLVPGSKIKIQKL